MVRGTRIMTISRSLSGTITRWNPATFTAVKRDAVKSTSSDLVDALRPHLGQWVAVKGARVLIAADTPGEVVEWLRENAEQADGCFRVPENPVKDAFLDR